MLWTCAACTTRYAHSLQVCPHCGSPEREEDGMPKTSVIGGPSYAGHVDVSSPDTAAPEWAPVGDPPTVEIPAPVEVVEPAAEAAADPAPRRRNTRR